ncbi:DHCW motif cupin fold protein [Spirosoma flavum]|uniref:DHCW motif cupin fold protein n=1 Tax=Spirosoma flavum TaxID=2048557 RepID=A0ABW6AFP4_9BACT
MWPTSIPFQVTDWANVPATEYPGESGTAFWRSLQFGSLRVRLVEYSPGYLADHWCQKGHILYVVSGVLETELETGEVFRMLPGMSYEVSDEQSSHRSRTDVGATLFVVDGDFLAAKTTQSSL